MLKKFFLITFLLFLLSNFYCPLPAASAGEIVIKIRAVNPLKEETVTPITAYLPKGATPDDVVKKGNFKVNFDKEKGLFYLEQKMVLKPKQVVMLQIEVKDVWVISDEKIERLRKETEDAVSGVRLTVGANRKPPTDNRNETALALRDEILKQLANISERQRQNTIKKAGADKHIAEYWKDVDSLRQVESDIKMLRTLVEKKPEKKAGKK